MDIKHLDAHGYWYARNCERLADRRRTMSEWAGFLGRFHWQAFVTLTFRDEVTFAIAANAFRAWLGGAAKSSYVVVGYERGPIGGRVHIHALIGGLRDRCSPGECVPLDASVSMEVSGWKHGNAKAETYRANQGAEWYLAKCWDLELVGVLRVHRRRRRRLSVRAR